MNPDHDDFATRLQAWIKRMNFARDKDAAVALGISREYLSKLLHRKKEPGIYLARNFALHEFDAVTSVHAQVNERTEVAKENRLRERAVAGGLRNGSPNDNDRRLKIRQVPLIGWAQAGAAIEFEAVVDWDNVVNVEINDPKAMAIRVKGDSMAPQIEEGDIIVLACSDRPEDEQIVAARIIDEGVVVKRLKIIDYDRRLFRLISLNPRYEPIERVENQFLWIYPVDQLIKKMRR